MVMLKNVLCAFCAVWLFAGCKTITMDQVSQKSTRQQVGLGIVGLDKDFILQGEFNSTAIPMYGEPLKVMVTVTPFTKQTYKAFLKAKALQSADVEVDYIDSIKSKPRYIKFQIADKVALINALNSEENSSVKKYLSHNINSNVLTSVSLALGELDLEAITNADAVFLAEKGLKTYVLQLYKNALKTKTISFNQGVVFAYKQSNCCWQGNKRHRLDIVDLVAEYNNCPNNTYRSAKRAEKKMNSLNDYLNY